MDKVSIVLPLALEWWVTRACNSGCKYCSKNKPEYSEIEYDNALDAIIKLAPKHIFIMGGEPTLVDKLPGLLKKIKKEINPHIGISTNLLKLKKTLEILPYVDDLVVSLDTFDKQISIKYRKVDPCVIVSNIRILSELNRNKKYNVNISVNSVVYKENLKGNGIENLNDALFEINKNIWHLFCPLYPVDMPGSIVNSKELKEDFMRIIKNLKDKNRNVMVNYPDFSCDKSIKEIHCYRRYFRVQLIENKSFFSPCPPAADIYKPVCGKPCATALFIDDILYAEDKERIRRSQLSGRLKAGEVDCLENFVRKHINPKLAENIYADLGLSAQK